ncbi:hypothetical protein ACMGDM_02715 [Sphingomonas sp. DT-51]|uniref:hypothetical protein n=1 Tax=Sphingomonas sp. DT-51 TaxID=3396165 RepID=UPI003F1DA1FA
MNAIEERKSVNCGFGIISPPIDPTKLPRPINYSVIYFYYLHWWRQFSSDPNAEEGAFFSIFESDSALPRASRVDAADRRHAAGDEPMIDR